MTDRPPDPPDPPDPTDPPGPTEPPDPTERPDPTGPQAPELDELYRVVGIDPPTLRRGDVAERSGIDPAQSLRWWRAMGFAEVGDDELAFGETDLAVVLRLKALLDDGAIDDADILRLARLMGASFSRLANAQLGVFSEGIAQGGRRQLSDGSEYDIVSFVETTMNFVWRRHLLAALAQGLPAGRTQVPQAVGFADLSGFSRISKHASQSEITEIVETFEAVAFDVVSGHDGRVVKLIGDEVMFVSSMIDDAVEIALELITRLAVIDAVPPVHCGIAFGETVRVGGDVFGPTVNLASRLTKVARAGTIAVPRADGMHLLGRDDLVARWIRRPYDLRGIGRTRIISIRPLDSSSDDQPNDESEPDRQEPPSSD